MAEQEKITKGSIYYKKDGDSWMAYRAPFENLQESVTGWGDTQEEARESLLENEKDSYSLSSAPLRIHNVTAPNDCPATNNKHQLELEGVQKDEETHFWCKQCGRVLEIVYNKFGDMSLKYVGGEGE